MSKEVKLQIRPVLSGKTNSPEKDNDSPNPFDNAICSLCQASGRMIAVQCFKVADGITLVLERQGFKNIQAIKNLNPQDITPTLAFMNFVTVPSETQKQIEDETQEI